MVVIWNMFFSCSLFFISLVNGIWMIWCLLWCVLCYGLGKKSCIMCNELLGIILCSILIVLWYIMCRLFKFFLCVEVRYVLMFGECILMLRKFCLGWFLVIVISDVFMLKLILSVIGVLWLKSVGKFSIFLLNLMFIIG